MSMTEQVCSCGRPTAGAALCGGCGTTLAFAFANVAGHYEDLGTVAAKRTRYGGLATKGSIGKAQPLPVDMRFVSGPPEAAHPGATIAPLTQLRWDAWNTVVAWCRTVMDEQSQVIGPWCEDRYCLHVSCNVIKTRRWPTNSIQSMCLYLDRQHRWIEGREWAPLMLDEFLDLERRLTRAVNRPPDRWYAGKCSALVLDPDDPQALCMVDLYAEEDRGTITCPGCTTRHDVTQRRDFLLNEAKDYHVTASEAARALMSWTDYDGSENKLVDRIRKWRDRDKLEVCDVTSLNGKDRHLYRLGDIQRLLVEHAQREQARSIGV
jgi:hypothetical protein